MTLLGRLRVLVVAALMPTIAIQVFNEYGLRRARQIEAQDRVLAMAKLAAAEHQQIVQGIRQILVTLSELPAIKAKDAVACNAYLTTVSRRFPAFLALLVSDFDGNIFCNSVTPHQTVNVASRSYFAKAMESGRFTIGEVSTGLLRSKSILPFALTYSGHDGRIAGLIIAGLRLDWLAHNLAQKDAPAGGALAIVDRNGTYLARYPDNSRAVGRKMPVAQSQTRNDDMTVDAIDIDGVERIVGFSALGEDAGGLAVSFGLDKAQAFAAIRDRTLLDIVLIALSAVLVLGLTAIGARRFIHRPLGQLVEAANAWQRGDYARRVPTPGVVEIDRVAAAFNCMVQALQERERELLKAKEKAEEAAAKITTIFESTTDSVLVVDKAWQVTYLNQRARDHLVQGRDVAGLHLSNVFSEAAFAQFREALSTGSANCYERCCARLGSWLQLNVYPSEEGLAIYFRDITEHKKTLEAGRLTEEQLHQAQKMEATGQLTGGIAHDFNNLLTVVRLKLEAITERAADADIGHLAAAAQLAAERGATLTAQLLAFSRRQQLELRLVSVNESIREFMPLIRRAVGAECQVKLLLDSHLWRCQIDPAQLQTALLNLAINARDAMGEGGLVTIETRNVLLEEGTVPGCLPGSYVCVSVSDNGPGMAPEVLGRAFEPFFTTKETGKGSGLGLSMVYGFVRQSGGDVTIESAPGVGATVLLYLPKAAPALAGEAAAIPKPAKTTGTERILLVEDDEAILAVTSDVLTGLGYHVTSARNGPEALHLLGGSQEFDLLFTDIGIPEGMNGVELAREAKRLNKAIKVLLTSGYAADVLERHQATGEFPVIGKPFLGAELAQSIRMVLQEPLTS